MGKGEGDKMVKKRIVIFLILISFTHSFADVLLSGNLENKHIDSTGELSKIIPEFAEYALLIGSDGTAAFISADSFYKIEIQNTNNIFSSQSQGLPPVCNIKDLVEICIYRSYYSNSSSFTQKMKEFEFLGTGTKNGHFARKYKKKEF